MRETPISYDQETAADVVGLSPRSVSRAVSRGDLTAHYYGAKPLIRREDLIAWVQSLPTESPAERRAARRS